MPADRDPATRRNWAIALQVALIYLALGLAWIIGSDLYLHYTAVGPGPFPLVQMLKGSAFVCASAIVIYGLVNWLNTASEAERQRRESVERGHRALVQSMPDAVFTIDPDSGRVLDANPAAESLFRLDRRQLIGLERTSHTVTDDEAFRTYRAERRQTGQSRAILTMIRGDGTRFPADVSSAVFRDEAGLRRASCVIRDISEQIERERSLKASEERLSELTNLQQAILNSVFAHIALVDEHGVVQFANERWWAFANTGELPELGADAGSNLLDLCESHQGPGAGTARRIAESMREVASGGTPRAEFEFAYAHQGERRWRRIAITPFAAEGQRGVVVAHLNVTDRRAAEARRRLVDAAFQSTDEAILICDENFLILDANVAYLRITGFEREDALESKPPFLEIGEQARAIGQALAGDGNWRGDLIQRRVNGETFVSWATVNVVHQREGEPRRLVVTFSDVSELRDARARIHHLSYHDPITNLPNRAALEQWFTENVQKGPAGRALALIYLDLDRFKTVNESFGHGMGDEVLQLVSDRLRRMSGPRDALARLGGDEFVFVADGIETDTEAVRRAQQLLDRIAEPLQLDSRELYTTAAAGITLYPRDGLSLEELLREADAALDRVKLEGRRGGISRFQPSMREFVDRKMQIERRLRFAVANDELDLVFQPIVSLPDSILCSVEALVRWNSPELGPVGPDEFIPVAEDTGLIGEIGYWVLDRAFAHARVWRRASTRFEGVSVNISISQFQQPGLAERIELLLNRHDIPGELLCLEITESVMMLDPGWTLEVLQRLQKLGVKVAIDDFGTGYSSMTYLRELPVQYLKLDKSFVHRLPHSESDANIMRCLIELSHKLSMETVAEGIETAEQKRLLQQWGCDRGQGYYFERPMPPDDVTRTLNEGSIRLAEDSDTAPRSGRR